MRKAMQLEAHTHPQAGSYAKPGDEMAGTVHQRYGGTKGASADGGSARSSVAF
jgi:hypothetical protein